ncbi:MAG TPA: hypothetical protein VNL38_01765 [Candidatus Nitrosotenuis sp.]|nr:hypothetical protein [Candidatus Nitrosotenuis sp.]
MQTAAAVETQILFALVNETPKIPGMKEILRHQPGVVHFFHGLPQAADLDFKTLVPDGDCMVVLLYSENCDGTK